MQRLINTLKAYLAPTAPAPAIDCKPLPPFPYIVRDRQTKQIIMRGSESKCRNYIASFGGCFLDTVS